MSSPVICVENLSKLYRLGEVGTGSLAHDVNRWWHLVRGKEDPYALVGQVNDRTRRRETGGGRQEAGDRRRETGDTNTPSPVPRSPSPGSSDYVWALRDINFSVHQGEVLGIIGRNGAGKSTLLKILSRVTGPTTGNVKVKGRIASLLEVGTGFNLELTGRENIYLNGSILGMRKAEIDRKLDDIVEFSGCAAYLDTPVKRYSSGMMVRLGFAVAAHLEAEILVVDEVLAVGDLEFQNKCFRKMDEVSGSGRTVLLVSHQMGMIRKLCQRGILLDQGTVVGSGLVADIVDSYCNGPADRNTGSGGRFDPMENLSAQILGATISGGAGNGSSLILLHDSPIAVTIDYTVRTSIPDIILGASVLDRLDRIVFTTSTPAGSEGDHRVSLRIPGTFLTPGNYTLALGLHVPGVETFHLVRSAASFRIVDNGSEYARWEGFDYGCVFADCTWSTQPLTR